MLKSSLVWVVDKIVLFALLIVIFLLAPSVKESIDIVRNFSKEAEFSKINDKYKNQLDQISNGAGIPLQKAVETLDIRLEEIGNERKLLDQTNCFLPTCELVKSAKSYRLELEISLIQSSIILGKFKTRRQNYCEELRISEARLDNLIVIAAGFDKPFWAPMSDYEKNIQEEIDELSREVSRLTQGCKAGDGALNSLDKRLQLAREQIEITHKLFLKRIDELKSAASEWMAAARGVALHAFFVLLTITISPLVTKLLTFYVIAPLAAQRPGIIIDPRSGGDINLESRPASLLEVVIELLSNLVFRT